MKMVLITPNVELLGVLETAGKVIDGRKAKRAEVQSLSATLKNYRDGRKVWPLYGVNQALCSCLDWVRLIGFAVVTGLLVAGVLIATMQGLYTAGVILPTWGNITVAIALCVVGAVVSSRIFFALPSMQEQCVKRLRRRIDRTIEALNALLRK